MTTWDAPGFTLTTLSAQAKSTFPEAMLLTTLPFLVVLLVCVWRWRSVQAWSRVLLSRAIEVLLLRAFPIKHTDRPANLPSLPFIFPNGQGDVEKFLNGRINSAEWAKKYGSLYRIWSGASSEVVLTKASHVETVFRDSHKHTKAFANDSGYMMNQLLGSCLGLISGRPWENLKQAVELPFLHRSAIHNVHEAEEFTKLYMAQLISQNAEFGENGILHPVRDLKFLPFLFVASVIYGKLTEDLQKELLEMVPDREALFRTVVSGGVTRFWFAQFLPFPAIRSLYSFKTRWAAWNDRALLNARSQASEAPPIIGMYDSVAHGAITREQLLQTLDEMLFANLDVTMGGLSWPLVFLAAHPTFQNELRNEIRAHSESRSAYLKSSFKSNPTLLGACLLESARLRPLAAFSVAQSCPTARVLDGFNIPAGTKIVIDSYALNIRDPFWGEDRERFVPQRWLDRLSSGHDLRYRYWRFGFGPRTCLGKHLVEILLRTIMVEILDNWRLSLDLNSTANEKGKRDDTEASEAMAWPWDDETWIHHPNLTLRCERLTK